MFNFLPGRKAPLLSPLHLSVDLTLEKKFERSNIAGSTFSRGSFHCWDQAKEGKGLGNGVSLCSSFHYTVISFLINCSHNQLQIIFCIEFLITICEICLLCYYYFMLTARIELALGLHSQGSETLCHNIYIII